MIKRTIFFLFAVLFLASPAVLAASYGESSITDEVEVGAQVYYTGHKDDPVAPNPEDMKTFEKGEGTPTFASTGDAGNTTGLWLVFLLASGFLLLLLLWRRRDEDRQEDFD